MWRSNCQNETLETADRENGVISGGAIKSRFFGAETREPLVRIVTESLRFRWDRPYGRSPHETLRFEGSENETEKVNCKRRTTGPCFLYHEEKNTEKTKRRVSTQRARDGETKAPRMTKDETASFQIWV